MLEVIDEFVALLAPFLPAPAIFALVFGITAALPFLMLAGLRFSVAGLLTLLTRSRNP